MKFELLVGDHPHDEESLSVEIWVDDEEWALVTLGADGQPQITIYALSRSPLSFAVEDVLRALSLASAELLDDGAPTSEPEINLEELLQRRDIDSESLGED